MRGEGREAVLTEIGRPQEQATPPLGELPSNRVLFQPCSKTPGLVISCFSGICQNQVYQSRAGAKDCIPSSFTGGGLAIATLDVQLPNMN